jgi:hypothetical protein
LAISGKKEGKDKAAKKAINIYEVKPDELDDLIESNEEILVLFYNSKDVKSKPIVSKMDKLDFGEFEIPVVKISDDISAIEYGLEVDELPKVVLFQRGIPEEYPEDLNPEGFTSFTQWIKEEMSGDDIPVLELSQVPTCLHINSPHIDSYHFHSISFFKVISYIYYFLERYSASEHFHFLKM